MSANDLKLKEITLYDVIGVDRDRNTPFKVGTFRSRIRAEEAANSVSGRTIPSRPGTIREFSAYESDCGELFVISQIKIND